MEEPPRQHDPASVAMGCVVAAIVIILVFWLLGEWLDARSEQRERERRSPSLPRQFPPVSRDHSVPERARDHAPVPVIDPQDVTRPTERPQVPQLVRPMFATADEVGTDEHDQPYLALLNRSGNIAVMLGAWTDGEGYVTLFNEAGARCVELHASRHGGDVLILDPKRGDARAGLLVDAREGGILELQDARGKATTTLLG